MRHATITAGVLLIALASEGKTLKGKRDRSDIGKIENSCLSPAAPPGTSRRALEAAVFPVAPWPRSSLDRAKAESGSRTMMPMQSSHLTNIAPVPFYRGSFIGSHGEELDDGVQLEGTAVPPEISRLPRGRARRVWDRHGWKHVALHCSGFLHG